MLKEIFYDWFGLNRVLFDAVQAHVTNHSVLMFLKSTSSLLSYKLFPFHMLIILGIMLYVSFKNRKPFSSTHARALCVAILAICIYYPVVNVIKPLFHFMRPICTLEVFVNSIIPALEKKTASECLLSFPSGHAAYVATFVFGLWTVLDSRAKILGVVLIALMAFARMAKGAHYPADVVYGILFGYGFTYVSCWICSTTFVGKYIEKFRKLVDVQVLKRLK